MGETTTPGTPEFEPATLANITKGRLEEQYQTLLAEVAQVFETADEYLPGKDGEITATITLEIGITRHKTGMLSIAAGGNLKRPKRWPASGGLYFRRGQFCVLDEADTLPLFGKDTNVRALAPRKEGGE